MAEAEDALAPLSEPLKNKCFYPAQTFFVDYLGDVLLCAHDWGKKYICGNINSESILDVWNGVRFKKGRMMLLQSNRSFSPCNVCNVLGTRMRDAHAEAYENFYNLQ